MVVAVEILEKNGTKIAYAISGNETGPKIVLIHGLFLNADCWRDQLSYFEQDYHILRFDLHGHGRSIKTGKRYTIRNYVDDMVILMEHLGWNSEVSIMGHSLGGMVALVYALEHPEEIHKLVVASSYCFVSNEAVTDVAGRVQGNPIEKFALGIGKRGLSPYNEEDTKWIAKMVTDHMTQKDALYATAASAGFNICENLRNLEIPTLLIVGKEDITTPVWASEMLHEWLPQSDIIIVDKAGHLIITDHADEFNSLVDNFLKK
ncbi:MAG: alpha/beta fold hydrolase [Candidatus Lokiarchaeota archaeon]|nr:alpha/beta fold hydrolase [Candidatus Lokiarchaeota archaeon]